MNMLQYASYLTDILLQSICTAVRPQANRLMLIKVNNKWASKCTTVHIAKLYCMASNFHDEKISAIFVVKPFLQNTNSQKITLCTIGLLSIYIYVASIAV